MQIGNFITGLMEQNALQLFKWPIVQRNEYIRKGHYEIKMKKSY